MFSHRFHRLTQMVRVRKILPQISQIYTDGLSAEDPPTDCTEFKEPSAGDNLPQISQICTDCLGAKILPQISQNSQKLLWGMFSHRFHRSAQIVWVRKILPQIAQNSQNLLLGDGLPQISQINTDG